MTKISLLSFVFLFTGHFAKASNLRVTSLNVEWYGRGGVISGTPEREYRDQTLKEFLTKELPATDVFVFQEITNPEMLTELFSDMDCFTYDAGTTRHQHIVMCAEKGSVEEVSVNYDVRLGSFGLRSALIGKFKFKNQKELSVIGLHLKAGPFKTETRLEQMKALLKDLNASENTLIIGDLNTYPKERTGLEKDDSELITEVLKEKNFVEIQNPIPTFLGYRPKVFDRAWGVNLSETSSKVFGPCNKDFSGVYADKNFYERFVSDHCALQVEFDVSRPIVEEPVSPVTELLVW